MLKDQAMNFRSGCVIAALVALALTMPLSSEAAEPQFRARFSYDAIANCENPHIRNFPVHGEGTGVLSADRSATLEMGSNVERKVRYRATLGAAPTAAPAGSTAIRVVGRHTLRTIRDYPNNIVVLNIAVRGNSCTMTVENKLKPGKRIYTFYNGSDLSYCARPQIVQTECAAY
jgi:hypothetical protein